MEVEIQTLGVKPLLLYGGVDSNFGCKRVRTLPKPANQIHICSFFLRIFDIQHYS